MRIPNRHWQRLYVGLTAAALLISGAFVFGPHVVRIFAQATDPATVAPTDPSVLDLNSQIAERRKKIEELNQQAKAFEDTVRAKEGEVFSLTSQLSLLDTQASETKITIERTNAELDATQLETQVIGKKLEEKNAQIADKREQLSDLLRHLYRERQRSLLEVAVVDKSFAEFFSSIQFLTQIQADVQSGLDSLVALQQDLQVNQEELTNKQQELTEKKGQLQSQQESLDQQSQYKQDLVDQTQQSQQKFESLLDSIRNEANSVDAEIATLEDRVRKQLGEQNPNGDPKLGSGPLAWPVDSSIGISAYFHDQSYPFRCTSSTQKSCIGEHSGIDIRAAHGTPVHAAADGYVAIARRLDWIRNAAGQIVSPAYNYITIIHGDGISTVYGHLSSVKVVEDTYVKKGDIIGLSGATPGTAGAGLWTTGPHLHFEVRKDGIPVDPLGYLQ